MHLHEVKGMDILMDNKMVLVLMQLKGISRKTIFKSFILRPNMECKIESIVDVINRAKVEDRNIKQFSISELEDAIIKADKIIKNCDELGIKITTFLDHEYPIKLRDTTDLPTVLYYKGNIKCLNEMNAVAIIGTREPTEHGMKIARNLGSSFGKRNYIVISGLAVGCDSGGHEGCLDENGKTVAVMPCGLEKVYPAKNKQLAQKILENNGCLISEYPPYTRIFKNLFVERDRLQSGLSDGVLVVETGEKGGTLHTVGYAVEYGRVIACYNHPEKYLSEEKTFGNQKLIREGKAMAVGNNEELAKFREKMEKKGNNQRKVKCTQSTIFDFIDK